MHYISESTLSRKLNGQIPFMEVEEFRMFCELNLSAEEIWGYYSCFVDTETLNYLRNVIEKAGHKLP